MSKKKATRPVPKPTPASRSHRWLSLGGFFGLLITVALLSTEYESYASLYDASYTGSEQQFEI
jgi:hypothetical protein